MNQEVNRNPNSNNEEVDVIRLLNYFKNGIKSFFRAIWNLILTVIQFIVLLKKNWIIVGVLTLLGLGLGWYYQQKSEEVNTYEMVVKGNPISNIELYALSNEINSQYKFTPKNLGDGVKMAKNLGIERLKVEPIEKSENVINSYFNQIEGNPLRADQTDTIFYLAYQIDKHKSNMDDFDYNLQKIQFELKKDNVPEKIQADFLNYINNLPGVKKEQESKLSILTSYESTIKNTLSNIDSLLISKAVAAKESPSGSELMVNTASRGTVEGDLLRYTEIFSKKLFGVQKEITEYQKGINVVSNLRLIEDKNFMNNSLIRYGLMGFISSCIVILLIQFNKYLNRFSKGKTL